MLHFFLEINMNIKLERFIEDFVNNGGDNVTENDKCVGYEVKLYAVYILRHVKTGKIFADSGIVPIRSYRHLESLKNGKHRVAGLQKAYDEDSRLQRATIITETLEEAIEIRQWIINRYKNCGLLFNNPTDPRLFDKFPLEMLPLLDGAVAGDGHISPPANVEGGCDLVLGLGIKQLKHADEFANRLSDFGFSGEAKIYANQVRVVWRALMFGEQRKRWYPDGIKRLPPDVSNDPEMWRWLYAGDGSIYQCSTYGAKIRINVQSFTLEETERLASMLKEHEIEAWASKDIVSSVTGQQLYILQISTSSTEKFLEMTSPPVAGLEYKWNIPERIYRNCKHCNDSFLPKRSDMMFCSKLCGVRANQK